MMLLSLNGVPRSVRRVERHLILQALYQDPLLHSVKKLYLESKSYSEVMFQK